jgi:hypothetical protein
VGDAGLVRLMDQHYASHSEAATEMQSPRNFLPISQEFPGKLLRRFGGEPDNRIGTFFD